MEPLLYVIAILGCTDMSATCSVERPRVATFRTEAGCRAAQDDALAANSDLDYPVIVAECRQGRLRMAGGGQSGAALR